MAGDKSIEEMVRGDQGKLDRRNMKDMRGWVEKFWMGLIGLMGLGKAGKNLTELTE